MNITASIAVPTLVRVKPDAIDRVGLYLSRPGHRRPALLYSDGIVPDLLQRLHRGMNQAELSPVVEIPVREASMEQATGLFTELPVEADAIVGFGGGKALDVAKYVAFLAKKPFYAVPTSLSNDGFCSPGASLTIAGRRRSLPSRLPYGVVLDTRVCRQAPAPLWASGVGDLVAKVTAVFDWKLAFHRRGTPVNDLAALLSDATVMQFMAAPERTDEGARLLGTALMLNGIAMEICGSSRPASGSEHLISHALDEITGGSHLHGIQVGIATYIVSRLQGEGTGRIAAVLERAGFRQAVREQPLSREALLEAARRAPDLKKDFYTVLSERDCVPEIAAMVEDDPWLEGCFSNP
ncbi:MAG: iron-containing alcohol dehydrogenase family protein [Gammaproteobacteria bacterium]